MLPGGKRHYGCQNQTKCPPRHRFPSLLHFNDLVFLPMPMSTLRLCLHVHVCVDGLPARVFQTGEFSARFLLKLPVDFSNIPIYLLKVGLKACRHTHTLTLTDSHTSKHTYRDAKVKLLQIWKQHVLGRETAGSVYRSDIPISILGSLFALLVSKVC